MQRMRRLDGVRGLLAMYVLLSHALPLTTAPLWAQRLFAHGQAAVELFFALSGLVIAGALERHGGRFWPFIQARARRLLPVYLPVLATAISIEALGDPLSALPWTGAAAREIVSPGLPQPLWAHLLAHLTLLHGIIPDRLLPYGWVTLLGPAWSLSTEWQFYLLIGLAAPKRLGGLAALLLAVALLYALLPAHTEFSRAFLPAQAGWFALGLCSRIWLLSGRAAPFLACLAGLCLLALLGTPERALTALLWLALMLAQTQSWGGLLANRGLLYLGAISYPLYLVNEPVERLLALWLGPPLAAHPGWFSLAFLALAVLGSCFLAAMLHHVVELPFMRQSKKKLFPPVIARPVRE